MENRTEKYTLGSLEIIEWKDWGTVTIIAPPNGPQVGGITLSEKDILALYNKLSESSESLFLSTIMTYSYLPQKNLSDKEFLSMKINWLIENNKDDLLEKFLLLD